MTEHVVAVTMDDPLSMVKDIFENTHFHHLLVVEGKMLYGVISDRDLFKALSPNIGTIAEKASDLAMLNKKAHQIMSRNPVCLNSDSTIEEAVGIFRKQEISCIPVVDENKIPVGILSWRDIFKVLNAEQ